MAPLNAVVRAALVIAVSLGLSACDSSSSTMAESTSTEATTSAAPAPTNRPYCQVDVPGSWQQAIDASVVDTGGVSTVAAAVGPAGEVAAVRDNGDTRDLLLIGADKSVTQLYGVPEPNRSNVGFVAMDARWVVVGVDRIPRNSNGVLPTLIRIDVIDRDDGAVRTAVAQSEADYGTGGPTIDSVALFGGKVYWIVHDTYSGSTGTLRSYDLAGGEVADVKSGDMSSLRPTAAGLTWIGDGQRREIGLPATLPTPVADAVGTGPDRLSLATDGTAYAWLTGLDQGTTGVAWWSPDAGPVRVTGDVVGASNWLPPVRVVGPYLVIERGRQDTDTATSVVDTRSGAVTYLDDRVQGAGGGTIALHLGPNPNKGIELPGVLRADALPPLRC